MNFTLRTISPEGVQTNHVLGTWYTLVRREHTAPFKDALKHIYGEKLDLDNDISKDLLGFVGSECQRENNYDPIAIYEDNRSYIMTEEGKTYAYIPTT